MAETGTLPLPMIIEEDEIIDDDFYEKIQAPKFVDLTAPDLRRSEDDRHWFCFRVGCDQKHEQELDSEAVYKNFVLRVMAARSPSVRLRKALKSREEASANLKCPKTAPPKSRVSRMALISSFSHKINDNNVKVKPLSKKVVAATPNAKVRQLPAVAKALTSPRNQKKVSNVEQFRTVQSKKAMNVAVPKTRVVAKALVFHSPKKVAVKTKSSIELNTPMKALCSAMKKLELVSAKKNGEGCNSTLPGASSRKQVRGREVKSRVFDSLYSNNNKGPEANTVRCLKGKKVKSVQKYHVTEPHEDAENDYSSDMEIDDKSRGGSLERCNESATSGGDITSLSSSNEEENTTNDWSENEERRKPISEKGRTGEATKRKDEENSLASDDKENEGQLTENGDTTTEGNENEERSNPIEKEKIPETTKRKGEDNKENEGEITDNDDKENASAPNENRTMISNNDEPKKAIFGSKHEDSRKTHKQSTSASTVTQVVKYKKLKPTNPKPFKLRTDERGILKEANLVKKLPSQLPLKEATAKSGLVTRKCLNIDQTSEQDDPDKYSSCGEKSNQKTHGNQSGSIQSDNPNGRKQLRLYARTPHRNHGPKHQKPTDLDNRFQHGEKAAKKLDGNCNRKSQVLQRKVVRPRVLSMKQQSHHDNDVSSPASKATRSASRPLSRGGKALTVPKEPKFHSLHVPKRCTAMKQT